MPIEKNAVKNNAAAQIAARKQQTEKFSAQAGLPLPEARMPSLKAPGIARLKSGPLSEGEVRAVLKCVQNEPTSPKSLEMMEALRENKAIRHPVWVNFRSLKHYRFPDYLSTRRKSDSLRLERLSPEEKERFRKIRNAFDWEFITHAYGS